MSGRFRLAALALLMVLPLTACASMLERPYSSSVDHVEYARTEDSSVLRAETYRGLVDAVLYFINAHAEQGVVRLYNYTGDVSGDLAAACAEILQEDPLAAFAVEDIDFSCSRIVSYYEASLTLTYSHTAREIDAIRFAAGDAAMKKELQDAMENFSPSLALRMSYFPGDEEDVRALAIQAYYDTPQAAFGMPEFQIALYPPSGAQRIVEVNLQWPAEQRELESRAAELLALTGEILAAHPLAEGQSQHTPQELLLLLRSIAAPMDPAGAADPYSALSGSPANQLAHALALELLYQQAGLEAELVTGRLSESDACWLIVNTDTGWRHIPLAEETPTLYTDLEFTALGYLWNAEGYPACVDYEADLSGAALSAEETLWPEQSPS